MNTEDFNKVVATRVEKINAVLVKKAAEYSSDTDRLHNFKAAARMGNSNETPEQALWGMMRKHLVSVVDIVDNTSKWVFPTDELRDEKIGDSINYLVLLEALLIERGMTEGDIDCGDSPYILTMKF